MCFCVVLCDVVCVMLHALCVCVRACAYNVCVCLSVVYGVLVYGECFCFVVFLVVRACRRY